MDIIFYFYGSKNFTMKIGIDSIAFDLPKIHLPIETLAKARHIDPEKLQKGLGLFKMTLPDVHQDPVVFGANAIQRLLTNEKINPLDIDRIYVGTESAVDSAKPIGSYIVSLMEAHFGEDTFSKCDVVDFTFACIAGVDALHNCIDYIRVNPDKKAIVLTTDIAKYDLESTGEYTQGAGAIALLISKDPKIIAFDNNWATSTKGVFDFFKPRRTLQKEVITGTTDNQPWFDVLENEVEIHQDQPVFDGQYSNQCYMDRTRNAYFSFKELKDSTDCLYNSWKSIIMHLPYAFQGRRMLSEIFALDSASFDLISDVNDPEFPNKLKEISKSESYKRFVEEKLMPAELASSAIGNLYTGSIFMALLSTLSYHDRNENDIIGSSFGFLAYGSGSKSKVFEGEIQKNWKEGIRNQNLFKILDEIQAISLDTYTQLHKKERTVSVKIPTQEWILKNIETEIPTLKGARYYQWVD